MKKQNQHTMKKGIPSSGMSFIVYVVFVFFFLIVNVHSVFAATKFYTISDGDWSASIWSNISATGASCNCTPGNNTNKEVVISKKVTISGYSPFKLSGGAILNITGQGKIIINTSVEISGSTVMFVGNTDSLIINGNVLLSGGSSITVAGYLQVTGNVTLTGNSTICGSGLVNISGSASGSGICSGILLPINLLYFKAEQKESTVLFSWATATEINNDYFTIENSVDGINFNVVERVSGAGNIDYIKKYTLTQYSPEIGIQYYRLKQTDYDGKFTYSPTQVLKVKGNSEALYIQAISPNPFMSNFNINYSVLRSGEVDIELSKYSGQLIQRNKIFATAGHNLFSFVDTENIPRGIYFVRMSGEDGVITKQIVKY